jgi:peroxiredoxin
MSKVPLNKIAPDFEINNYQGKKIHLSDYKAKKNILLVFNRGFV